jgi:hypothetical protein
LFFENHAVYEIMWKNVVQPGRPQMIIWRMRIACWLTKTTNTHSEYVIFIAVSLQQRLHERASKLRYTYIAVLSSFGLKNLADKQYNWVVLKSNKEGCWIQTDVETSNECCLVHSTLHTGRCADRCPVTFNCISQMSFSIVSFCDMDFSVIWAVYIYRPATKPVCIAAPDQTCTQQVKHPSHIRTAENPSEYRWRPELSVPVPRGRYKIESNDWLLQASVAK